MWQKRKLNNFYVDLPHVHTAVIHFHWTHCKFNTLVALHMVQGGAFITFSWSLWRRGKFNQNTNLFGHCYLYIRWTTTLQRENSPWPEVTQFQTLTKISYIFPVRVNNHVIELFFKMPLPILYTKKIYSTCYSRFTLNENRSPTLQETRPNLFNPL